MVLMVKNLTANTGNIRDTCSIPGSGRSPGEGYGNTLQYSCLRNPMDRGAWWATVCRVAESQLNMTKATYNICMYILNKHPIVNYGKIRLKGKKLGKDEHQLLYKLVNVFLYLYLTHECMFSHSGLSNSLRPYGLEPARLLSPWDYPSKNTGAGSHFLLWRIFPTQR